MITILAWTLLHGLFGPSKESLDAARTLHVVAQYAQPEDRPKLLAAFCEETPICAGKCKDAMGFFAHAADEAKRTGARTRFADCSASAVPDAQRFVEQRVLAYVARIRDSCPSQRPQP